MSNPKNIRSFGQLFGKEDELSGGTVVEGSVDTGKMTCSVKVMLLDDPITNVQLNVLESNVGGVVAVPEDGSHVWMAEIDGAFCILRTEKIKQLIVDIKELVLKCPKTVINDGTNGGVPITGEILKNINELKSYVETMKQAVSAGIKAVGAGATANGTTGATAFDTAMAGKTISFNNMNNDKIKH